MAGGLNPNARCRELYIITVKHKNYINTIELAAGTTAEQAAWELRTMVENHKRLVEGSAIVDEGKPVYRIWKLHGTAQREDVI